jgi:hypothetical protein
MTDKLLKLVQRRHPQYDAKLPHWDFVEATYEGGREWFKDNIFRYLKEGDGEYADRVKRAYRFNHTRQVVDVVSEYLFKVPAGRKEEDAPEGMKEFWERATRSGLDINEYAKRIACATSQFGRIWIVVDSTAKAEVQSKADEKNEDIRIYSYYVRPQQALDMSHDSEGVLNWILLHELHRQDEDPMESSGKVVNRYRLWTRTEWILFEEQHGPRGKVRVEQIDRREHGLGEVPVFPCDHKFSEEPYTASGMVDDVAYMDRAGANYLSNLDAIIQDQTYSQLALPAQGVMPGEDGYDKLVEMGTKRVFLYNGEAGKGPEYLSPDVKQAELILQAVGKIINEIYHSVGLAAERTKEDNGGGIDNASGVAKSYDFERVNGMLVAKADALETFEARLTRLVQLWRGKKITLEDARALVQYPRDFDVRGLYDEFEIAAQLSLLAAPDALRREQMRTVADKLFPTASEDKRKEIESSLKSWPPAELMPGLGASATGAKPAGPLKAASAQKTAKQMTA